MRVRNTKLWVVVALASALAACGGPAVARMKAVKPVNENDRKESVPVDVRFFLLKDEAKFNRAPVENLWTEEKAKAELGEDLVSQKTETIRPGVAEDAPREIHLGELSVGTNFVGLLMLAGGKDDGPRKMVVPAKEVSSGVWILRGYHVERDR
jgi:type VI secretion system VasD/TssJ family lipoprotein